MEFLVYLAKTVSLRQFLG